MAARADQPAASLPVIVHQNGYGGSVGRSSPQIKGSSAWCHKQSREWHKHHRGELGKCRSSGIFLVRVRTVPVPGTYRTRCAKKKCDLFQTRIWIFECRKTNRKSFHFHVGPALAITQCSTSPVRVMHLSAEHLTVVRSSSATRCVASKICCTFHNDQRRFLSTSM